MLKYKINFYLYKESLTKPGYFSIRAYISYAGKRPYVYTGIYVNRGEWDAKSQRVDSKDSIENLHINDVEKIIRDIFKDYDYHEERYPSPKELKDTFDNRYKRKLPDTIIKEVNLVNKYYEKFIEEVSMKDQWSDNTIRKHNKIRNHFNTYDKNLDLLTLTENDLIGIIRYFQTRPKTITKHGEVKLQNPHKNTTVSKDISDFKTFLRWAKKKKYYFGDLHETFTPKFKGINPDLNDIIYFSVDKLLKFYNHKFDSSQKRLEEVRDVIAFCCFSSLRFSDVAKLKKTDIKGNEFKTVTKKTVSKLNINLNDYSRAILNKYKDSENNKGLALPVISMQKTNDYLKEIGQILNFNEPITTTYYVGSKRHEDVAPFWSHMSTHMGRRTFVVISIYLGIPETVIMKFTGHSDYKAMKPYIAVIDEQKTKEMSKFNFIDKENLDKISENTFENSLFDFK
ncbi:phage integrase SAM-like domain-containing protein [Elizabethkingia meningoseptica]|uniref:site-specific integrase n=1 Tax=Elizabethkingia meningoseptica TaxID=238 RepID=UPI0023B1BF01|nr:site-specific integrase [Elizabethkingia meningoseptica]MDE5530485.1 phage integrase SAM-like domain-containing protein [Elizabethkingia meningoseptica]MDE5534042.1 phage integrase SAM-like domain-containing protein [Elizabethkingia meningoseptica]MDE5542682.1 phage integrase SAM-like domain-containing protein [Elizabethkingia meningoseptica]